MMEENWNTTQKMLFEKYFMYENGPMLEKVHENAKPIKEIWQKLYNLLQKNIDGFDENSKILKIKKQSTQGINLLIFKIMPYEYFIIDINEEKTLNREKIQKLLDEEYFIFALNEDRRINLNTATFHSLEEEIVKKILDLFYEYNTIYTYGPKIMINVSDGRNNSSVSIKLDTGEVILSFISNNQKANYVFLDENLIPIGTSNPTNNIEDLKNIAHRIKTIPIPQDKIPDFIIYNQEIILKKLHKND